jgi:hypothetical protein
MEPVQQMKDHSSVYKHKTRAVLGVRADQPGCTLLITSAQIRKVSSPPFPAHACMCACTRTHMHTCACESGKWKVCRMGTAREKSSCVVLLLLFCHIHDT